MSIDSSVVPEIKITPPNGELLYVNPYIGEKAEIDEYGNVQITHGYLRADWDSSYPQPYTFSDVKANYIANPLDTSAESSDLKNIKAKSGWDGVVDSLQTYPGLVYDSSYPPTHGYTIASPNISSGLLYLSPGPDVIDSIAECQWKEVEGVYINDIENPTDTSTEPSDLNNTKSNIRKIKPDINSDLKRV